MTKHKQGLALITVTGALLAGSVILPKMAQKAGATPIPATGEEISDFEPTAPAQITVQESVDLLTEIDEPVSSPPAPEFDTAPFFEHFSLGNYSEAAAFLQTHQQEIEPARYTQLSASVARALHEKEQMQTILTQSMQLIQQTEAAQKSAQAPEPTPEPAPAAPLPEKASLTFDLDSSLISDTMRETLAPLAQSLIDRPDLIAQVRGYTDSLGDKKYNAQLAQVRAEAVMDALIDLGAPAIQLKTLSFGESQSSQKSTPNDRRVELVFRYR